MACVGMWIFAIAGKNHKNANSIKFRTPYVASVISFTQNTDQKTLITGIWRAANAYASKFSKTISIGISNTVSASAKKSRHFLLELSGILTLANVRNTILLGSAQVSLFGSSPYASSFFLTPSRAILLHILVYTFSLTKMLLVHRFQY
jgi:hypothetical protein